MNYDILINALENDNNISIIQTNIQEIKQIKNDILQKIGLKKDNLKSFNYKLKDYRYIENTNDLRYGEILRWINLQNINNIQLNNTAFLCKIQFINKRIALLVRTFNFKYFYLYFDENLIFQKLNQEEKILLKAINYLK